MTAVSVVQYDEKTWIEGEDENGVACFSSAAHDAFLEACLKTDKVLDSEDYVAARHQLTAIREDWD